MKRVLLFSFIIFYVLSDETKEMLDYYYPITESPIVIVLFLIAYAFLLLMYKFLSVGFVKSVSEVYNNENGIKRKGVFEIEISSLFRNKYILTYQIIHNDSIDAISASELKKLMNYNIYASNQIFRTVERVLFSRPESFEGGGYGLISVKYNSAQIERMKVDMLLKEISRPIGDFNVTNANFFYSANSRVNLLLVVA
ncbi:MULTISPECIES: hypothetical protein [Sphingobacterium]|uniref:hypothetical protein n=1 Tax=Sphingobacterium TaxID=28453 RepID=UPI0013DA531D|nr:MULTISPECIES: hypothetical protein [unclassified Sphingobacterium]